MVKMIEHMDLMKKKTSFFCAPKNFKNLKNKKIPKNYKNPKKS